jgi:transketolase
VAGQRHGAVERVDRERVGVEAGIALGWRAFTGDFGGNVSLEHFGASAAYGKLYEEFGITAERVAEAARASLARLSAAATSE